MGTFARLVRLALVMPGILAGCAEAPSAMKAVDGAQAEPRRPLIVVPGPGREDTRFQADDGLCRANVARMAAENAAKPAAQRPPPMPSEAEMRAARATVLGAAGGRLGDRPPPITALPPGVAYLRCMMVQGHDVRQLRAQPPATYALFAEEPVFAGSGYGLPFFYDANHSIRILIGPGGGYRSRYGFSGNEGFRTHGGGYTGGGNTLIRR